MTFITVLTYATIKPRFYSSQTAINIKSEQKNIKTGKTT